MVRPFVSPIDKRSRELYGRHESRYKVAKTMQPFDAPISESGRDLYGEHEYRYKVVKQMQPFDAPISERQRELYGEYQSRYYQPKEYQPFGTPIDEYSRQIYGAYRSRYSTQKISRQAATSIMTANGVNWVDMTWAAMFPLTEHIFDKSIYQYDSMVLGAWAGQIEFRIFINDVKVYPFDPYDVVVSGTLVYLGSLSMNVRTGDEIKLQFRSNNAADGAGEQLMILVNYVTHE